MAVKAVPHGWHTVTPRLFVANAAKLVEFLKHAFGATRRFSQTTDHRRFASAIRL